ncbi:hypothetical protein CSUI_006683 [Cystoisospora suis]|uniref:Uncharacterized protein n=1 Tax=Cystoisospora suis TaxID=483139 RepID=A0A2C6KPL3_9APIC|nr:hypothetical protein CSUI_006683 [Cystoisospora suis]
MLRPLVPRGKPGVCFYPCLVWRRDSCFSLTSEWMATYETAPVGLGSFCHPDDVFPAFVLRDRWTSWLLMGQSAPSLPVCVSVLSIDVDL